MYRSRVSIRGGNPFWVRTTDRTVAGITRWVARRYRVSTDDVDVHRIIWGQ